jgi:modulator of FtsH protease HflK
LFRRIDARFNDPDGLDAGIRLLFVGIASVHPPRNEDVAASFEGVVSADIRKAKSLENARSHAVESRAEVAGSVEQAETIVNELRAREALTDADEIAVADRRIEALLDEAGGEAAVILLQARADRWTGLMRYRADAEQQESRIAAYRAAPSVYLARMYLDALRESIQGTRLYITTSNNLKVQYDLTEIQANFDAFGIDSASKE